MSPQKLTQTALQFLIVITFFSLNSLRAEDYDVLKLNFEAFIPQYVKEIQKNAKEDFEFSFGKTGKANKEWWTLWGLLDSRRSPFDFPELQVTNFDHTAFCNQTLEKAYQNFQAEYHQNIPKNQFTIPFIFSHLFSSELRAFMKFPWLREEREAFAFRQLELEALSLLKRDAFYGRRQYGTEYLQAAIGVRVINFGRVLVLPQRAASIEAGLNRWIENGSKIEWKGQPSINNANEASLVLPYAPLQTSEGFSLELQDIQIPTDVEGLTDAILSILDELDKKIETHQTSVSQEELMYALIRYSNYQTVFELTNLTLLKYFKEFRDVEWPPVSIQFRNQLNCHSSECLRETIFYSLNQEYLAQVFRKIFFLYGQIAERPFGGKLFPDYSAQLGVQGFSRLEVQDEYERRKNTEYIDEVHLENQVIRISVHTNLNASQIIGYFEREILPSVFEKMLNEASRLFSRSQNMDDVEAQIPMLREKYLNQVLEELVLKTSDDRPEDIKSETFSFSQNLHPKNIEENRPIYEDQIFSTTTNILFEQFRRYYKSYLQDSKDLFPIDLVVQSLDPETGLASLDLVLLKDFSITAYKSFYESQLDIEQDFLTKSRQEANISLARQIISHSVSVLDKDSVWICKTPNTQESTTNEFVLEIMSSIQNEIEENADLFYTVRRKKDPSFARETAVTQAIQSKFIRQNAVRLSMPDKGLELLYIDLEPSASSKNKIWSVSEFLSLVKPALQLKFEATMGQSGLQGMHCLLQEISPQTIDRVLTMASQIEHLRIVSTNQHRTEIKMRRTREQNSFDAVNFLQR